MSKLAPRPLSKARFQRYFDRASSLREDEPFVALDYVNKLISRGGESAELFHLEADILLRLGMGSKAALAAERALLLGGDRMPLQLLILKSHLTAFNRKPAASAIKEVLKLAPLPVEARFELAKGAQELHQYELAERLYEELLNDHPASCKILTNLGYACQRQGKMKQAIECYRLAAAEKPDSGYTLRLLAGVQKQTEDENCLDLIFNSLSLLDSNSEEFVSASYALGKTHEDLEKYPEAFKAFSAGAAAMRPLQPYSTAASKSAFDFTKAYFTSKGYPGDQNVMARQSGQPVPLRCGEPQPVFVIGMPRSGSTLLDRMLDSHSEVISMGELGCFKEAMKVQTNFGGGGGFHEYFYQRPDQEIDLAPLGAAYIDAAGPEHFSGRYFTDKYHMNFMDLGLIASALPDARFIHTIRNPMDTVFSNFKQLFTLGFFHYSYSLKECAEYYLLYKDLMAFWHECFPNRIIDIEYEKLVENAKPEIERVLAFLGLQWEDDCLNFHRNKNPVDTASLSQVRQPIYKSAVSHWKRYGDLLDEAANLLQGAGVDIEHGAACAAGAEPVQ